MIGYHYTSMEAFLSIVSSQKIRLTNIKSLNDGREYVFGWELVRQFAREHSFDLGVHEEAIDYMAAQIPPYWVTCFSTVKDSFSQWMIYGDRGEGVCLGFDVDRFATDVVPVIYGKNDVFAELEKLDVTKSDLFVTAGHLVPRIKQDEFNSEREVRVLRTLIYPDPDDAISKLWYKGTWPLIRYRPRAGRLYPYVETAFVTCSLTEVWVGPRTHSSTEFHVKHILQGHGFEAKVLRSDIVT